MELNKLAKAITGKANVVLKPASAKKLELLRSLGAPEPIISFYECHEPSKCAEIAEARLWPIAHIVEENTNLVPGCDLHRKGFVVFATTAYGDVYCIDLNEKGHPVVLMPHETTFSELSATEIRCARKIVASNFSEFLQRFASGKIDIKPL